MSPPNRPSTLRELRESGWRSRSVRDELRRNLVDRIRSGRSLFPGMVGYEETVVPAAENALLAGHDMIFLGERGQGKSRLIRALVELLDEEIPVIEGSDVNDDPLKPISKFGRERLAECGDSTPIAWISREQRYGEKLATPDVTMADLIGEIDPIKVAEGHYLADETTIHFGLIPRTNRGIFCINELPDLAEKVQVGLFNVLEERDLQVKGFKVRLPLDILIVASANPEDYTRRGRIITPLKDRYQAQIRTHYPTSRSLEIQVMEQESCALGGSGVDVEVPTFVKELIAELTLQARQSPDVSATSGVSVRATIANYETLIAAAERRALRLGEKAAVPRISDLGALLTPTAGKIELEYGGSDKGETVVVEELLQRAVKLVFDECFELEELAPVVESFGSGWKVEVGNEMSSADYLSGLDQIEGLRAAVEKLGGTRTPDHVASTIEFILEGLHLSNQLNKDLQGRRVLYR